MTRRYVSSAGGPRDDFLQVQAAYARSLPPKTIRMLPTSGLQNDDYVGVAEACKRP